VLLRCALVVFFPLLLAGQSSPSPAFEVASVKQNNSPDQRSSFQTSPNGVTITNYRLQFLIPNVYNVPVYAVSGAPGWLSSNKYDIVARAPEGSSKEQFALMLQQLLADRFKLKFHREQKDLSGYALMPAKDGPRVKVEKHDQPEADDGRVGAGQGQVHGHMISSATLAQVLSLYLNRPVLDQTGIDGTFNVDLKWTPDATDRTPGPPQPDAPASDPQGPSLFSALEEQLGLRLAGQRTSVQMFVIDHIDQVPTEN
jgi:uncharacterized protein (TIGR03435 family)